MVRLATKDIFLPIPTMLSYYHTLTSNMLPIIFSNNLNFILATFYSIFTTNLLQYSFQHNNINLLLYMNHNQTNVLKYKNNIIII
jgi:hypothetical protein